MLRGISLWILSFALSNTGIGFRQDFDEIRERIRQALVEGSIPSMAVAAVRGDQIIWEEGFGWVLSS